MAAKLEIADLRAMIPRLEHRIQTLTADLANAKSDKKTVEEILKRWEKSKPKAQAKEPDESHYERYLAPDSIGCYNRDVCRGHCVCDSLN